MTTRPPYRTGMWSQERRELLYQQRCSWDMWPVFIHWMTRVFQVNSNKWVIFLLLSLPLSIFLSNSIFLPQVSLAREKPMPSLVASHPSNREKNRYNNVLPCKYWVCIYTYSVLSIFIGQLPRVSGEDPERIRVDSVVETSVCSLFFVSKFSHFLYYKVL